MSLRWLGTYFGVLLMILSKDAYDKGEMTWMWAALMVLACVLFIASHWTTT